MTEQTEGLVERREREAQQTRAAAEALGASRVWLARRDERGNPDPYDAPFDRFAWAEPGELIHEQIGALRRPAVVVRVPSLTPAIDRIHVRVAERLGVVYARLNQLARLSD